MSSDMLMALWLKCKLFILGKSKSYLYHCAYFPFPFHKEMKSISVFILFFLYLFFKIL